MLKKDLYFVYWFVKDFLLSIKRILFSLKRPSSVLTFLLFLLIIVVLSNNRILIQAVIIAIFITLIWKKKMNPNQTNFSSEITGLFSILRRPSVVIKFLMVLLIAEIVLGVDNWITLTAVAIIITYVWKKRIEGDWIREYNERRLQRAKELQP